MPTGRRAPIRFQCSDGIGIFSARSALAMLAILSPATTLWKIRRTTAAASSSITPFALVLLGRKVAIADAAGAAQALFHSRLENGLDFPAGVGNIPLVYHISENGHYIKAVGGYQGLSFAAIKRTWYSSKVRFKSPTSTTSRPILLWSLIMTVATFPARISSSIASPAPDA